MEKMREEFEAWAAKYNLARADWGNYQDRHVNNMWKAWKASRAAQCVELPLAFSDERATTYLTRMTSVLDAAGIRYV